MKKITTQDLLQFFRQLSTLISSGISLHKSFELLLQTQSKLSFRKLIQSLCFDLESGKTFYRSLQRHPKVFDRFSCQLIRIGEQSGTLEQTLWKITQYQEKTQTLKKQIQQALIYPAITLSATLLSMLFLLLWVVPQFAVLFEHFPNKIPSSTQALIQLARGLQKRLGGLGCLTLLSLFLLFHFRASLKLRQRSLKFLCKLPGCRSLFRKLTLTHFSHTLAGILSAGLPLTEALLLVAELSPHPDFRTAIYQVHAGVSSGKRLSSSLKQALLFPTLLVQMVHIGEESGTLDRMLEKFAEIAEAELEKKLSFLRALLGPLIIAILGVLIGGVIITMYLPIFRLGTAL